MSPRPNFFIVGAPKSGTTALYTYLADHPNIFLPEVKEPHYFAKDLGGSTIIRDEEEYFKLFRNCNKDQSAIGEASTFYLFSDVALELIRKYEPESKIIVMLRNPVDLVYSFYIQARYNFYEDASDFEIAWSLQQSRAKGENIPKHCREKHTLQYKRIGSLGSQVERLFGIFPRDQVMVIFFEDFVRDVKSKYQEVIRFLGVPSDGREYFPKINESKVHRLPALGFLLQRLPEPILKSARFIRKTFHMRDDSFRRILSTVQNYNRKSYQRSPLRPEFRHQLAEEFRDDVEKLSRVLGKDLGDWLH